MKNFLQEESGSTAIEYGLIAALVAIFMLSGLGLFSSSMVNLYSSVSGEVGRVMP